MIRVPVEGIRISGRNTQGVKVMNLTPGDLLVDVARVVKEDEADDGESDADDDAAARGPAKSKKAPAKTTKKKK
jgi:DNA gyrase subunit A